MAERIKIAIAALLAVGGLVAYYVLVDRPTALREMLKRYLPPMHENVPVHEWPID